MECDVLIIGGGVIGCAIARELTRYNLSIAMAEAKDDVSAGASRANSAIVHAGYDAKPGSAMARLNVLGNDMYQNMCEELSVPFERIGSLVLAFGREEEKELERLLEQGVQNGVKNMELISLRRALELEPQLSREATGALWAPSAGITSPYQLTIALYENARANGLNAYFNAPVTSIAFESGGFSAMAGNNVIRASYIVNAAGIYADDIARLIGDDSFTISPRKGEYILMDHETADIRRVLFRVPSEFGKGVLVAPTVDRNAFVGPTAKDILDKDDTSTTYDGMRELRELGSRVVPSLDFRAQITAFSGLRAISSTGDFILRESGRSNRFIHAAGISSPGLTAAPAIAKEIAALLNERGLPIEPNAKFNPRRAAIERFADMTPQRRAAAIKENPQYGHVICRCETVTEAEIAQAVHRGARTLDGVKRRVRAGMGRCQGGFCAPRVMEIIARETGMPMETITKNGGASRLLIGKTR
ncbi:MAG: FAD-dependent oxidoreductase [Oscillospiraceae bacterium]|jgi:glycerol-3-phosphate dehydrogenase|nr:FAD-dependent oxidoreductase [Oscillospiraceae bacterium]